MVDKVDSTPRTVGQGEVALSLGGDALRVTVSPAEERRKCRDNHQRRVSPWTKWTNWARRPPQRTGLLIGCSRAAHRSRLLRGC